MFDFLKRHWFILTLTAAALAAAAVTVFFPPAILAALTISLASSSAFAALGSAAVPVAMTVVAVASAAAVYAIGGLLKGVASLFSWGYSKLFGPKKSSNEEHIELEGTAEEDAENEVEDHAEHVHGDAARAMRNLHKQPEGLTTDKDVEVKKEVLKDRAVPPPRRAVPANDAGCCCGLWSKKRQAPAAAAEHVPAERPAAGL